MRNSTTSRKGSSQRGMALIMVLLFLILTSALAFALLYKVNSEQKMQRSDSGNTAAFYAAEAGMEKINSDLNLLYTLQAAPDWCDIQTVVAAANEPNQTYVGATYPEYAITVPDPQPVGCAPPLSHPQTISQGPNAGLQALIVPLTVRVTAQKPSGEQVAMIRNIEIAQIPVFQFGMFSETDLSFFPGGTTDLNGRVQTNHNLYLTPGGTLTLHSQVRAAGDVVRDRLPNGRLTTDSPAHTSPVYIPTQPNGCDGSKPACRALSLTSPTEGSSSGGPTLPNCDPAVAQEVGAAALCSGTAISGWQTVSLSQPPDYGGMILSGSTGAKALKLAFVQGNVGPVEIIRRPEPGDSPALTASRLYNLAQIRVLLSDDPSELPASSGFQASGSTLCASPCLDPQNIRLANIQTNTNAPNYTTGVPFEGSANAMMFAEGTTDTTTTTETDWVLPGTIPAYAQTMVPNTAPVPPLTSATTWNLLDGYLRVEIRQTDGTYLPVTQEWLQYGFARLGYEPPTATSGTNTDGDAILVLQHLADRNADGIVNPSTTPGPMTQGPSTCQSANPYSQPAGYTCTYSSVSCSGGKKKWTGACTGIATKPELVPGTAGSYYYGTATRNNWYPNNFYDPREGEWRGNDSFPTCSVNGVMNATDIDVGNLRKWLMGSAPYASGSGPLTESDTQNGYVLYFSDRRGMLANATTTSSANGSSSGFKDGEYGFEDVINTASSSYLPNNSLDDGEDVNGNTVVDTWGKLDLGYGLGASAYQNPGARIACLSTARKNWVSGARHVVRLVDGWRGKVPTKSDGTGGFTLASENPAYVVGDYNALTSEGGSAQTDTGTYAQSHANSAVISDSLVLLSNSFTDLETWQYPTTEASRTGATTYYRMAIATGKNMNYPYNSTNADGDGDFGTDGGTHNFLHYIESQSGHTVSYLGSMVSLYYSMYATGVHKGGNAVYSVPTRDYGFDPDFLDLNKMPPGTPRFRDVVNLGFQQVF